MKKIIAIVMCLFICVTVLAGCKKEELPEETKVNDPAVVGTWSEHFFDSGYVFKPDGTGTDTFWNLTFTYTAYEGTITLFYDDELWGASQYSYEVAGNILKMTRTDTDETSTFEYMKVAADAESATETANAVDESGEEGTGEGEGGEN
ncbi:MAG: DUF5640 domain-containing protein [Lachnospiraceae bacterium]|jgi:hypothetical protein